jgi:hypothetical protein
MERGLLGALGVIIALVGGLFFTVFAVEAASGGNGRTEPGVYAGLIVVFGGLTAAGLYLAWRMLGPRPSAFGAFRPGSSGGTGRAARPAATPEADRERRVLRLAEKERGRVTVPEVAARCDMTVEEAKAILDRLVVHDVAEIHVTDGGVLVYVFPGFLSDRDKAQARDF